MKIFQEYEKKYRTSLGIVELGHAMGVDFGPGMEQIDVYYDTAEADLFVRGIFLRIRDHRFFQAKVNLDDLHSGASSGHTRCTEIETGLTFQPLEKIALEPLMRRIGIDCAGADTCHDLFQQNGLQESLTIKKVRHNAHTAWGTICFDRVENLGDFIEIEAHSASAFSDGTDELKKTLARLLLQGKLALINAGYNSLIWRERNPAVYARSPYMLSADGG